MKRSLKPSETVTNDSLTSELEIDGHFVMRFQIDFRKIDIAYSVEATDNLSSEWNEVLFDSRTISQPEVGFSETREIRIPLTSQDSRFVRLRITEIDE